MNVILAGANASFSDWTDFPCQRIKLVGKRHLVAALQHELTLSNHVHQFDADQNTFSGWKCEAARATGSDSAVRLILMGVWRDSSQP